MKVYPIFIFSLLFIGGVFRGHAQDCNCAYTIAPDQERLDGNNLDLQPGDTICIEAGNRNYLRLENFQGVEGEPLIFTNCGGQVVITGNQYYAIGMVESSYFHFTGTGISFFGYGNNRVYNNLLIRCGALGIYHNDRGAREDTYYYIVNNTIVSSEETAIRLVDNKTRGNIMANNLLVDPGNGSFIEGVNARWTEEANLTITDISNVYFKDPQSDDYQLTALSPAIDAGMELPGNWLKFDALLRERPGGNGFDIGAFEYDADKYEGEIIVTGLLDHYEAPHPLKFYPNPVEGTLHLELEDITAGTMTIKVYNLLGKMCLDEKHQLRNNTLAVNLEQLPQGKYFMDIMHNDSRGRVIKILKK